MEKYMTPEMEIVAFDSEDVITTSSCNPESIPFGGPGNGAPAA